MANKNNMKYALIPKFGSGGRGRRKKVEEREETTEVRRGQRLNNKIDTVLETFFPFMNRPTRAVLDFTTKYISNPLYETLSTNPIFRNTPFNPLNVRTYRNFDSPVGYFNFGKTLAGVPHDIVDYNKNKQ